MEIIFKKLTQTTQSGFSYFEFKIRLIRLGLSFQKTKIPYFKLTTNWFSFRNHNHYTKEPTVGGRHRKAVSNLHLCLTDSSWIHLILLIKLIPYKIGKNTNEERILVKRGRKSLSVLYFLCSIVQTFVTVVERANQIGRSYAPFANKLKRLKA